MTDKFMVVVDRTKALRDAAESCYRDVVAVFAQKDVTDTHVFVIYEDGGYVVAMYDAPNEDRETPPDDRELENAIDGCPRDEQQVESLARALALVTDGNPFESKNAEFVALVSEAAEESKLARMSKYARKRYLRGQ